MQTLSGLQSGTRYHFRVRSTDQAGVTAVSSDKVFSTTGSASSSTPPRRRPRPVRRRPPPHPHPAAPTPPPVVVVPAAAGATYGVGIGGDTRNNHPIDGTVVSYRFRASDLSRPRSRSGCRSARDPATPPGPAGRIRATVEADNGGKPSGTVLASVSWNPGNPGTNEQWPEHFFSSASPLVAGRLYHVVFTNVDASPSANYISLNSLYTYNGAASKPLFGSDFALLEGGSVRSPTSRSSTWRMPTGATTGRATSATSSPTTASSPAARAWSASTSP